MKNRINFTILLMTICIGLGLSTSAVVQPVKKAPAQMQQMTSTKATPTQQAVYEDAKPLDIVANPTKYLHKKVKFAAKFDKFSTLGLDYKPAFRSADKYISILIKRDDVLSHTVPLSEMKIFMERIEAEKYIDLESGDTIEIKGTVFSNALGDAWLDVNYFTVISSKSKVKNPTKK